MKKYTRLLLPIGMVLGTFFCAYAAFFIGVKEDLPIPVGATRNALSTAQQTTIAFQWTDSAQWKAASADVVILKDNLEKSVEFYRSAYVNKRGWREVIPTPGQPKDAEQGQQFTVLCFAKDKQEVIIAITPAATVLKSDTAINKAMRASNIGENDLLAVVLSGQFK